MNVPSVDLSGMIMKPLAPMLKTGPWFLKDLKDVSQNGKTVFSCFHCGGGSTMGYKLSGFTVLGGVEIDPKMMELYRKNHNPKHSFLQSIVDFNKIPNDQLPKELFQLDILDGSPPCSSFSMAGSREKAWGEKKKFREGQADQVLDDLFFHFIDTANKLRPKIIIAENVKGLVAGKAKGYVKQIYKMLDMIGYDTQLFLLNAAFMGVPQTRERVFFIARKKELSLENIKLAFNEKPISIQQAIVDIKDERGKDMQHSTAKKYYDACRPGEKFSKHHPKESLFSHEKLDFEKPSRTITSHFQHMMFRPDQMVCLSDNQIKRLQSFPDDYNFLNEEAGYVCGMSVPPFMMNRVSNKINEQWLSR